MKSNYLIWDSKVVPNACVLKELVGVEQTSRLRKGVPIAAGFLEGAAFTMDPDFPDHTLLPDNLINTDGMIVASARLKSFLESRSPGHVEYLPVAIIDHRGKPVKSEYFIIHPVDPVDCLDLEKCEPTWSAIDKTKIKRLKRLVIDETKVGRDRGLFKPQSFYNIILTRRDLAEALDREGFTGLRWIEPETFKS